MFAFSKAAAIFLAFCSLFEYTSLYGIVFTGFRNERFLSLVFWTHLCYHRFRREQRRTPRREIDKAKIERDDWKSRGDMLWQHGMITKSM
jgi:hypothetical protein